MELISGNDCRKDEVEEEIKLLDETINTFATLLDERRDILVLSIECFKACKNVSLQLLPYIGYHYYYSVIIIILHVVNMCGNINCNISKCVCMWKKWNNWNISINYLNISLYINIIQMYVIMWACIVYRWTK